MVHLSMSFDDFPIKNGDSPVPQRRCLRLRLDEFHRFLRLDVDDGLHTGWGLLGHQHLRRCACHGG